MAMQRINGSGVKTYGGFTFERTFIIQWHPQAIDDAPQAFFAHHQTLAVVHRHH